MSKTKTKLPKRAKKSFAARIIESLEEFLENPDACEVTVRPKHLTLDLLVEHLVSMSDLDRDAVFNKAERLLARSGDQYELARSLAGTLWPRTETTLGELRKAEQPSSRGKRRA